MSLRAPTEHTSDLTYPQLRTDAAFGSSLETPLFADRALIWLKWILVQCSFM